MELLSLLAVGITSMVALVALPVAFLFLFVLLAVCVLLGLKARKSETHKWVFISVSAICLVLAISTSMGIYDVFLLQDASTDMLDKSLSD